MLDLKELSIKITIENRLNGGGGIGFGFTNLRNLTKLFLSIDQGNMIGGQGAVKIGSALSNLINLKHLTLNIGYENKI